jgi:aldose 1-epimerase
MKRIEISDSHARAIILPEMGGSLASYDYIGRGGPMALMRPSEKFESPIDLASFPLAPFSGRVSGDGFTQDGTFHRLPPAPFGFAFPIHGNGWAEHWTPRQTAATHVSLELDSKGPGPFDYLAHLDYRLEAGALVMELTITNRAALKLPYGGGFHPWFPRDAKTRLQATAEFVWINDDELIPIRRDPVSQYPDFDFRQERFLPMRLVDTCFDGWPGRARIAWPDRGIGLAVEASPNISRYVLYSPSPDCGFFCFEPVSHASNAHNLPGGPAAHGLAFLATGETLALWARFTPLTEGLG